MTHYALVHCYHRRYLQNTSFGWVPQFATLEMKQGRTLTNPPPPPPSGTECYCDFMWGEGERGREGQTICPGAPTFQTVLKYKWQHTIQEWEQVLSDLLVSLRISWRGAFLVCFFPEPRPTCRGELLGLQNTHSYSCVHYKYNHMIIWLWHKKTSYSQIVQLPPPPSHTSTVMHQSISTVGITPTPSLQFHNT